MDPSTRDRLTAAAVDAQQRAYAPYSKFLVGVALLSSEGNLYTGVNIENASYGLTICAERVAVGAAISAGDRRFAAIAVASSGGVYPCGACRQFLGEFSDDLVILLIDTSRRNAIEVVTLRDIFPTRSRFTQDALE